MLYLQVPVVLVLTMCPLNLRFLVPVNVLTYLEVPVPLTGAHLQVPMAVLSFIFRCLHWGRLSNTGFHFQVPVAVFGVIFRCLCLCWLKLVTFRCLCLTFMCLSYWCLPAVDFCSLSLHFWCLWLCCLITWRCPWQY